MSDTTTEKAATKKDTAPAALPKAAAPEGTKLGAPLADVPLAADVARSTVLEALQSAAQGLLFPSETDAPLEPFFWPEPAPVTPSVELVASHAEVEAKAIKTQSLTTFFKPTLAEEEWHNAQEKAEVKRFQALLDVVKQSLEAVKVFRIGKVEIEVYVVGRVSDGYAGFKTKVVET